EEGGCSVRQRQRGREDDPGGADLEQQEVRRGGARRARAGGKQGRRQRQKDRAGEHPDPFAGLDARLGAEHLGGAHSLLPVTSANPSPSEASAERIVSMAPAASSSRNPGSPARPASANSARRSCPCWRYSTRTFAWPCRSFSARGVSIAASLPPAMNATRSHKASAVAMSWVVRNTVRPSPAASRTIPRP